MEVNEYNIGVTLVCPGPVQTNVVANAFTEDVNRVSHDGWCRDGQVRVVSFVHVLLGISRGPPRD